MISNRIGEGPLTPALTKRRDGKQEVTVRVPDAWIGQMMNLRAFDAGGKEVPILEPLQVPLNARNIQALLRYRFAAKPAIRSVELRKRDALVATFRGVHLYRKRP
jgi:hypothetical protein